MKRLRVLHLCANAGPSPYFCAWAEFGDRERFDTSFASLTPEGPMQEEVRARGARAFALDCTTRADRIMAIGRLASRLRSERIDVLQTHLLEAALAGSIAARLVGTPLVVFTGHHSHEASVDPNWKTLAMDRLAANQLSHGIIAHSRDMLQIFLRYHRLPAEKIALIPYPFDYRRWRPSPGARARIRAGLGLADDAIVFGAAGRLFWVKDYATLIKAFARVADREPKLAVVIVGEGGQRAELEALAAQLKVRDRVHLVGQRSDMPDLLSAIDVFVHTALAESFCQVVVEAFALERPVVSTRVGIAPEIIADDVNGHLVTPGDVDGLERALARTLEQRARWPQMGREGRERIAAFSADTIIPRYEAQYLRWLDRG